MKKLLLTLAALPLATYAVEASAQTGYYSNVNAGANVGMSNRIANLEARFNAGLSAGVFTNTERARIGQQLAQLRSMERSYSYNGLTSAERRTLQTRIRAVRDELRRAGGTSWARNYGWGDSDLDRAFASGTYRTDAYGRPIQNTTVAYDAYGRPIATGGVTYDAYGRPVATGGVTYDAYGRPVVTGRVTYDAYGRPVTTGNVVYDAYGRPVVTNGYYGQGGPYEPVPQNYNSGVSSILGGVLGSVVGGGNSAGGILGSILGNGGLRTGDVITSVISNALTRVPNNYSTQFQDRGNVYYRSDGQRVYEIDARTNQVLHIYPMR